MYLSFEDRQTAYENINTSLGRIIASLTQAGYSALLQGVGNEKKIIVSNRFAYIKIEPNYTLRGYVYEPTLKSICKNAKRDYAYAEMKIISMPELFGGKICAALDRQHPRDLFDIAGLFSSGEQDENLIKGFIAMLLGHNRPLHELLDPLVKDQREVFEKEFHGMTDTAYSYADHIRTFKELVQYVNSELLPYRTFLLDFISFKPDFTNTSIPNLDRLPAIRWKIQNLEQLKKKDPKKFKDQY